MLVRHSYTLDAYLMMDANGYYLIPYRTGGVFHFNYEKKWGHYLNQVISSICSLFFNTFDWTDSEALGTCFIHSFTAVILFFQPSFQLFSQQGAAVIDITVHSFRVLCTVEMVDHQVYLHWLLTPLFFVILSCCSVTHQQPPPQGSSAYALLVPSRLYDSSF